VTVQASVDRRDGYELILGSSIDSQLGPVLLFGTGGELVEVFRDRTLALPPLNMTLARQTIAETRISRALAGVRGRAPVDLDALASLLVRFGDLVVDQPRIREIDVNPLLVSARGLLALDARIVLHDESIADAALPRPAIRPYPVKHVAAAICPDGTRLTIRPIRPEDEPLLIAFHQTLSEDSVRMRYMQGMKLDARTAHQRLLRICFPDYDREIALVAEHQSPDGGTPAIVAVGRLSRDRVAPSEAEFSLLVADPWQGRGVGAQVLARLIEVARQEGIRRIYADILEANMRMQRLCARLGFAIGQADGGVVRAERET